MQLQDIITPLGKLPKGKQIALVEWVREDRTTSKAVLKKTTKKQRVNAMDKLGALMDSMTEAERKEFMERM